MTDAPAPALVSIRVPQFRYATGRAVALPRIEIGAGEIIALRGRSGSGKSTLLHLLSGLVALPPTLGDIVVNGKSVAGLSQSARDQLRPHVIGWIPQRAHLISSLPVMENVMLPMNFSARTARHETQRAGLRARAAALLDAVGLKDSADARADTLSVGQAARVCAARALLPMPKVLCADEPSAALDAQSAQALAHVLCNYTRDGGAVVLASHDDEFIAMLENQTQSVINITMEAP